MMNELEELEKKLPFTTHGYELTEVIKKGSNSYMFKAFSTDTRYELAAKVIYCNSGDHKAYERIRNDTDCLVRLFHPNIIRIYDRFTQDNLMFLIMEHCKSGNIKEYLRKGNKFTEIQIMTIMKQLLNAIQYCHSQGIAHGDIKPSNILISDSGIIKLTDFQFGIKVKEGEKVNGSETALCFKAPEIIKKEKYCPFKADIWSLGVTFYYIITGTIPWGNTRDIKEQILKGEINTPGNISPLAVRIIKKMLAVDPNERPEPEELLSHEYFASYKMFSNPFVLRPGDKNIPSYLQKTNIAFKKHEKAFYLSDGNIGDLRQAKFDSTISFKEKNSD